jgi:hypothetical protein
METRTVWQMVWDDYQKWLYKTLRGFGPFSLDRKKNSAIGLSKVVNSILAIIGTPWIIAHWVAFCNKNVRPQRTCNKVGYWIALIIALVFDLIPLSALGVLLYAYYLHPAQGLLKWFTILFVFAPLLYAGVSKLPYLFMNDPIIREEENQTQETEIEYLTDYEDDEEQEEEEEVVEEFPFCQIFRLGGDKDLHIMRVEYCPDETAFIRVVSNDSYTKPYKRKVQRDKRGERFILFNNERFYLDPNKTQPRMPE